MIIDTAKTAQTDELGYFITIGNANKYYDFNIKIGGDVTTSTVNTPKIVKNHSFMLKPKIYKKGYLWFDFIRSKWFSLTTSQFFETKR
jgi:hypothetical protein